MDSTNNYIQCTSSFDLFFCSVVSAERVLPWSQTTVSLRFTFSNFLLQHEVNILDFLRVSFITNYINIERAASITCVASVALHCVGWKSGFTETWKARLEQSVMAWRIPVHTCVDTDDSSGACRAASIKDNRRHPSHSSSEWHIKCYLHGHASLATLFIVRYRQYRLGLP